MDYQCPACRNAFYVVDTYLKEYPSKIYFQVRFHPLKQHSHGMQSAIYAECATRQKKFWPFHRLLFENQKDWENLALADDKFHEYAKQAGMDLAILDACLQDPLAPEAIEKENADSIALGVNLTPTFFVNGKMIAGLKEIEEEMKRIFPGDAH